MHTEIDKAIRYVYNTIICELFSACYVYKTIFRGLIMKIDSINVKLCALTDNVNFGNVDGIRHIKTLPHFSIVQSLEGAYNVRIDDGELYSTQGNRIFIAPPQKVQDIIHHTDPETRQMRARWVFLDIEINDVYGADLLYDFPVLPSDHAQKKLSSLLDELFLATHICERMSVCYRIVKILFDIGDEKDMICNRQFLKTVEYIKQNYRERISVSDLASLVFLSSPIAYLNDYRLAIASELLRHSPDSVENIACSVGITDVRYFGKIFKRKYLMTPTEYRNNVI